MPPKSGVELLVEIAPAVKEGLRAAARSTFTMSLWVAFMTAVAASVARSDGNSVSAPILAGAVSVATGAFLLPFVAAKNAAGGALRHGARELQIGKRIVQVLFRRVLDVDASGADAHGERGNTVARVAETIPLRRAEDRLAGAARSLLGEGAQAGFVRRRVVAALVGIVERLSLASLRDDASRHGGVDLLRVRDALESTIDAKIAETIDGTLLRFTMLVTFGFSFVSVAIAVVLRRTLA